MPAHKIGRLWKFKKDQVDAWAETGSAATEDQAEAMLVKKNLKQSGGNNE